MDKADFEKAVGRPPTHDDLERANCTQAGQPGHLQCGICVVHRKPLFECGCVRPLSER